MFIAFQWSPYTLITTYVLRAELGTGCPVFCYVNELGSFETVDNAREEIVVEYDTYPFMVVNSVTLQAPYSGL